MYYVSVRHFNPFLQGGLEDILRHFGSRDFELPYFQGADRLKWRIEGRRLSVKEFELQLIYGGETKEETVWCLSIEGIFGPYSPKVSGVQYFEFASEARLFGELPVARQLHLPTPTDVVEECLHVVKTAKEEGESDK